MMMTKQKSMGAEDASSSSSSDSEESSSGSDSEGNLMMRKLKDMQEHIIEYKEMKVLVKEKIKAANKTKNLPLHE